MAHETATLAAYVFNLKYGDIPAEVLERAKVLTLDFLGSAIRARSEAESTPSILKMLEARRQQERDRQLRERVLAAQVAVEPGERTFYFVTRKNRLRRLELSDAQAEALEQGRLAVVERPDPAQIEHALIPAELALALVAEFPKAVRFLNAPGSPVGFLTDEEVKARAAAEAAETPEERAAADAPESEEQRAEEAADAADADAAGSSTGESQSEAAGESGSA